MLFFLLKNIHSLHVCDILFLKKGCKNITVQCNSRFFMIYFNMQSTSLKQQILGAAESPTRLKPQPKASLMPGKLDSKHPNPRAVTVTLSNSYARQKMRANGYQRPTIEPDAPPAIRTRKPPVEM